MVQYAIDGFFLGTIYDLDPDESDYDTELANDLIGQTVGSGTPLHDRIEPITLDDANNDGAIIENDNGAAGENIIYDGVASRLDSLTEYNVTITYADGTTAQTVMNIVQDTSGRVFLLPRDNGNPQNDVLDDGPIATVRFDQVAGNNYGGIIADLEPNAFVTCFLTGTLIACPGGERRIEDLAVGDLVMTLDRGAQPIRWIGSSVRPGLGKAAPVRIDPGALGCDLPKRALFVTNHHRLIVRSMIAKRMFGSSDVLIPAVKLVGQAGIHSDPRRSRLTYMHIMFDRHDVIFAEGAPVESFYPGPSGLATLTTDQLAHVTRISGGASWPFVRPVVDRGGKIEKFLTRHRANGRALIDPRLQMSPDRLQA